MLQIKRMPVGQIGTNCYLLEDTEAKTCAVIDPGDQPDDIDREIRKAGLKLTMILITHGHFDHVLGVPGLLKHWPGTPVYVHEKEVNWKNAGDQYMLLAPVEGIHTVKEGDTIDFGGASIQVLHTPGHSPEQSSIYVPQERCVFVGDNIFNACQIWLHSVDFDALFHSLDWLQSLDVDYIIPGHGPVKGKECIVENKQFLYAWLAAVGEGIEKGWSKEECVERISFADRCLMDIGQPECMEYVQTNNVRKCYDYLMRKAEL